MKNLNLTTKKYWACFNYLEVFLPIDCIEECHHQGSCDADCEYWQRELELDLDTELMRKELAEYGAWSDEELKEKDPSELETIIIWIAAGNIQDDNESEYNKDKSEGG